MKHDGNLIFTEDGYSLYETRRDDLMSSYSIYSGEDEFVGEFVDYSTTDQERKDFKGSYVYELFKETIDGYRDWVVDVDSFDVGSLGDAGRYRWLSARDYDEVTEPTEEEMKIVDSLCKSDTIVFHQEDPTTTMLDPIYEGRGWDVYKGSMYEGPLKRGAIHELIKRHDKVLCLGHGTPSGLLSGVIGGAEAELLKEKKVFALWCYAATYFKNHGFQGHGVLCSDNAPSEVWECKAACDANVGADWIYNNMLYWSECLKGVIDMCWDNPEEACRIAREEYHKAYDECETEDERKVVEFNTNTLQVV